jgi:hypothetical protein
MGQTHYRLTDVAKTLSRFLKADLAEDLTLEIIGREFPGLSREQLLRALALCEDEVVLEYERSQELVETMQQTTAGYAALVALVELWRSHSEEQRYVIGRASSQFANTLDKLIMKLAASSRHEGSELLENLAGRRPH